MSTSERLTEITRERYETGAHGNAFLMMSKATMDAIPRPEPRPFELPPDVQVRLWDIPILLDAALPAGAWRLLDRTTGAEIESEGVPTVREGWAQAIEALRAEADRRDKSGQYGDGGFSMIEAADYLTDRAAALTEEGPDVD